MAANETSPPAPTLPKVPTTQQVDTVSLTAAPVSVPSANPGDQLYPPQGPDPSGTRADEVRRMENGREATAGAPGLGTGVEGEEVVWEGRYSMRNFIGRLTVRGVLTLAWVGLAIYTWGANHENFAIMTGLLGAALLVLWALLIYRMLLARYCHFYRLTTRRLFVSTGLMHRRRDQLELLRIQDVFTRQSLFERWLSLGTVVVVSSEKSLPTAYLTGVEDPKRVMDLIWHHARKERDDRSVKVQEV